MTTLFKSHLHSFSYNTKWLTYSFYIFFVGKFHHPVLMICILCSAYFLANELLHQQKGILLQCNPFSKWMNICGHHQCRWKKHSNKKLSARLSLSFLQGLYWDILWSILGTKYSELILKLEFLFILLWMKLFVHMWTVITSPSPTFFHWLLSVSVAINLQKTYFLEC